MTTPVRVGKPTPSLRRPWLRVLAAVLGIFGVALASLVTHIVVDLIASLSCGGFGDTGPPPPAVASPQGRMCGQYPSVAGEVFWDGGFLLSAIVTVVLIALAWR